MTASEAREYAIAALKDARTAADRGPGGTLPANYPAAQYFATSASTYAVLSLSLEMKARNDVDEADRLDAAEVDRFAPAGTPEPREPGQP